MSWHRLACKQGGDMFAGPERVNFHSGLVELDVVSHPARPRVLCSFACRKIKALHNWCLHYPSIRGQWGGMSSNAGFLCTEPQSMSYPDTGMQSFPGIGHAYKHMPGKPARPRVLCSSACRKIKALHNWCLHYPSIRGQCKQGGDMFAGPERVNFHSGLVELDVVSH
jgi:hypothetical protein